MNIVYLHQYFSTPSEPGGSRSYEFARRLVARGHAVHMITSVTRYTGNLRGWQESVVDGIHVHAIPVLYNNAMPYYQRIAAFFRFAFRSALRAARFQPDVVFTTSTPLTIALPGAYAAWRCRAPMVLEIRDLWPEMPIAVGALRGSIPRAAARWLERFAYRNASQIVALSPGMKDGVVAAGYPADKVHMIPNACDLGLFDVPPEKGQEFRRRFPFLGKGPMVIYAGSLGVLNGVDYLARIAAEYGNLGKEADFVVAGDGKERTAIESLARDLGVLDSTFHMIGQVPKADMPLLFSVADVATSLFIDMPEMWNNSANKFFDALAAGRPIAINHEGWQADLLRETGAGIVLPARDPKTAAHLLADFLGDEERLLRARQAARHLAETRFSRDLLFEEFERVLIAAVEEAHP